LLELTIAAEQAGFDTAAISDHFQPWRHTGGHAPFSLAWLGAAGQATSRIQLGTSVLTPTFRYHPAVVAQALGTLGCLFPGRIWLGVGTGESLNEAPLGVEWPDQKVRFARLKEAVTLIQTLWTDERVTFDGAFYRTRNATIYDRPETPVPIYIAASGPAAARLAGRVADGFMCTSGKGMELYADTLLPAVTEGSRAAGRDPADIDLAIEMKVSFDTDAQRALEDTLHWAALALSADEKTGVEDPIEMERLADELSAERAASRWIVSTDPDEHVERIRPYLDLGFTHLIFHAPGPDQRCFLELYARHILPRLRRLTS
jgi:coenzyme F420-dependent glucose-6-phosphate dehydrogenase